MNRLPAPLHEKLRQANEFHETGRLEEARAICEEILRREPKSFHALHMLGVIAARAGVPSEAVALIDGAIAIDPSHAAAHCNRGNELQKLNRGEAALASYDQAIRIDPNYAQAHSNRGIALTGLGRLREALASFEQAMAIRPSFAEAFVGRGNALKELNQLDDALASYDRGIVLRADYAEAHFSRAIAWLLRGDFERRDSGNVRMPGPRDQRRYQCGAFERSVGEEDLDLIAVQSRLPLAFE
jgi:tetratricopeptide (TPR) repeat protein